MAFHEQYRTPVASRPSLQKQSVQEALQSPEHGLDNNNRQFMESRFGQDFSSVKLHTGDAASRSAQEMNAAAYTVGQNIVFDNKHYSPDSAQGKHLLAHELTHTVQQRNAAPLNADKLTTGKENDQLENEADGVADKVMSSEKPGAINTRAPKQISKAPPETPPPTPAPTVAPSLGDNFTPEQAELLRAARATIKPKEGGIVGVLIAEDGRKFEFESGGGQGFSSHIEGKATAKMNELGITKATLLVEKEPCQICDRSVYDPEKGPEEPLRSSSTGKEISRQTPKINSALPRGSQLKVVGPESTGIYNGTAPPRPKIVLPGTTGDPESKPKTAAEPEEAPKKPKGGVKLPQTPGAKVGPKLPKGRGGGLGKGGIRGGGAIAAAALLTDLVVQLIILPKLNKMMAELEESRRQKIQDDIQKHFDAQVAREMNRLTKICYLKIIREMEAAGKQPYLHVEVMIALEDTSNRIQWFDETPPESFFDLEVDNVRFIDAELAEEPMEPEAGEMTRCENCGTFGRDKTFFTNNPLWEQSLKFSIEAPTSEELVAEFGEESDKDPGACQTAKGCFIATACYGSLYAPEVTILRQFRDEHLLTNIAGRAFVKLYYFISPPIARYLERHEVAKRIVRGMLIAPLVYVVREKLKVKSVKVKKYESLHF
jgi:hypothetical protein